MKYEAPDFAPKHHVPEMEYIAYNQMPKAGYTDQRLFNYTGTDLYQGWAKEKNSIWEDPFAEPFIIRKINA